MPVRASSKIQSAGLLLFRQRDKKVQVLLAHPGGPFWSRKDQGVWTIPKGLIGPSESLLSAAQREFAEETGYRPGGEAIPLGSAKQPGGKVVHVWAIEEDWDPADLQSNTFEMEWPPGTGRLQSFPEIDRASWFGIAEARLKILKGQAAFLDHLLETLGRAEGR
jgi:predicted NUDIX family NTP pyrophosphohydrolase